MDWFKLLIEILNWPPWITTPEKSDTTFWLCLAHVRFVLTKRPFVTYFIMLWSWFFSSNTFQIWQSHYTMNSGWAGWRAYNLRCLLIRWCMINSPGEFLLKTLDSPFIIKNSLNRAIFCSVFFLVFSFSCPSGNSSNETLSANLEVPDRRRRNYFSESGQWKARKPIRCFNSENFRLRPVIGYTIILTFEKNCPTSQIASNF